MQAYDEYNRIRHLAGFTIERAQARNVNQHMREYTFDDGSILRVYRSGCAAVATGPGDYRTITKGTIRANAFGLLRR